MSAPSIIGVVGPGRPPHEPGRLRVLVVDDDSVNRKVGSMMLARIGHEGVPVEGGAEALESYRTGDFDVILLDILMPGMDGFEVTAKIRESEAAGRPRTPIVALTACTTAGHRERCLSAGMDEYFTKPISEEKLRRVLSDLGGPPSPRWAMDEDVIRRRYVMNDAMLSEVVGLFRISCSHHIAEMRRGLADGDGPRLAKAAHSLKGSLGFFATDEAVGLAADLESIGQSGRLDGAAEKLAVLEQAVASLQGVLRRLESPC